MPGNDERIAFSAIIDKKGINPFVDVPAEVSAFFGRRGYVPVRGTINGVPFTANLVPVGGGRHCLYINGAMRTGAGVDVGDRIQIELAYDPKPRPVAMPDALAQALAANPAAKAAFEGLRPSRRKEILAYLNALKSEAALRRNVERVLLALTDDPS